MKWDRRQNRNLATSCIVIRITKWPLCAIRGQMGAPDEAQPYDDAYQQLIELMEAGTMSIKVRFCKSDIHLHGWHEIAGGPFETTKSIRHS